MKENERDSVWSRQVARRRVIASGAALVTVMCTPTRRAIPRGEEEVGTIDRFTSMFGELRQMGQRFSPRCVLPTLIGQTHALRGMAKNAGPGVRADALRLAARYAEFTGWMAQESGQDDAAMWWTDRAVEMATEGGDRDMAAYGLVRRALVTLYVGDAAQTIELARRAQRDGAASTRVRGLAAQREAQGHAAAGAVTECQRALDRSAELLCRADDELGVFPLGTSTVTNPVPLTTAWCLHDLGRSAAAARLLDDQLRTVAPEATRFRARWGARRALAYVASGEIDHACDLADDLLPQCVAADSATIRRDLRNLARVLRGWLGHPRVRWIYPALTEATRVPGSRSGCAPVPRHVR